MLDLICIEKCRGCGTHIPWRRNALHTICSACVVDAQVAVAQEPCGDTLVSYVLDYENPIAKRMVRLLKYSNDCLIAKDFSRLLEPALEQILQLSGAIPYVVPVPLHWSRQLLRGYNQSELIAETLCDTFGLVNAKHLLSRRRRTKAHHDLDRAERSANVQHAFYARLAENPGRTILLIDDVFTSGATLSECSKTLRSAGYKEVFALTAARAT
jgi:competence protein ComFC